MALYTNQSDIADNRLPAYKVIDTLISHPDNRLPVYKVIDPLISQPDNRLPVYKNVIIHKHIHYISGIHKRLSAM
jgi:hypothetical protein